MSIVRRSKGERPTKREVFGQREMQMTEAQLELCLAEASPRRWRLVAIIGLLPDCSVKRWLLRSVGGWTISDTASVGSGIYVRLGDVSLGAGSRVAAFSAYRDLARLSVSEHALVGHWNWIGAARSLLPLVEGSVQAGAGSMCFAIGRHAAVTSRHYIDCSGGVAVGEFTTVAGVRSTILSHQIDTAESRAVLCPVVIGHHAFVGSNVTIVPGATVPDRCIIGMGAVVQGTHAKQNMLNVGVPARPVRPVASGEYFSRAVPTKYS